LKTRWRRLSWYRCKAANTYTLIHTYITKLRQINYGFQFLTDGKASINVKHNTTIYRATNPLAKQCLLPVIFFSCIFPAHVDREINIQQLRYNPKVVQCYTFMQPRNLTQYLC
jgi:hypothetical protein